MSKPINIPLHVQLDYLVKEFPGLPRKESEEPLDYFSRVCHVFDNWIIDAVQVKVDTIPGDPIFPKD